ncbi:GNAT family N-acetyltransferase [Nitratireductor aquimarinus]|uniref:GNAT family N-acetyltransferase n=1 Tax=Nitratireductor aquimarinus TaxID=889300 RepID=A0ABU4ALK5_9HYPH|nr:MULTISPECIES: GNAT family N-acetyltransferase [Nitratireductor]MBN7761665.1 GNAT family N-acetyltransferase [Nitratireductor aquibiodomus]MBN7775550.1 GNAT family N-acetyltransferase [Nitratireductor pacificus]MBN7781984.1 GNAT family N-acetyltransferase [Nitratireductor pacificus]MBN7790791.1 GNAT family N-acetyltransferase [Nitratireductor aquimarinus]MBN8243247.1 GNAT family N-acetyltransferase [Nitratireductor aquimarinus]
MTDMLVPLYKLPPAKPVAEGIVIRRAIGPEMHVVCDFAEKHFSRNWASECAVAMAAQPANVLVAVEDGKLLGFACYDATAKGFFGPTGVDEAARGRGVGAALLMATLQAMRDAGYVYGVIGSAGPIDFYKSQCGAIEIPDSTPGIYGDMLR